MTMLHDASTAWRTARRHCGPACLGYHATWPIVRAAGLKASPRWHHAFYRTSLRTAGLLDSCDPLRVLVAGADPNLDGEAARRQLLHAALCHAHQQQPTATLRAITADTQLVDLLTYQGAQIADEVVYYAPD